MNMSSQEELEFELESNKCFIKHNVESHEYKMHNLVYNMGIVNVPKIYKYDKKIKYYICKSYTICQCLIIMVKIMQIYHLNYLKI
jgi:hypothetical protein